MSQLIDSKWPMWENKVPPPVKSLFNLLLLRMAKTFQNLRESLQLSQQHWITRLPTLTLPQECRRQPDLDELRGLHHDLTFKPSFDLKDWGEVCGGYLQYLAVTRSRLSSNSIVCCDFTILVQYLTRTRSEINSLFNYTIKSRLNIQKKCPNRVSNLRPFSGDPDIENSHQNAPLSRRHPRPRPSAPTAQYRW